MLGQVKLKIKPSKNFLSLQRNNIWRQLQSNKITQSPLWPTYWRLNKRRRQWDAQQERWSWVVKQGDQAGSGEI